MVQEFIKAYRAKYGHEPDIWSAYGWDAGYLVMDAMKRAWPDETRAKVRDELANTGHFSGANGELSIDPDTREVTRYGLTPVRVEGGKLTYGAS